MTNTLASPRETLEFLGVREVADLLRISRLSVYRLIESGRVPVYRILRCLRFKHTDIMEFLARNRTDAWRNDQYGSSQD